MMDILKKKKIVLITIITVVIIGLFVFIRLFIYDSYRVPDTEVLSNESTLTLDISDSALPSGVTKDQIVVEQIPASELPESAQDFGAVYAFKLEPDGLVFSEPIQFTLRIPSRDGAIPTIFHIFGDTIETLKDINVAFHSDSTMTITGSIAHFSNLAMSYDYEILVEMPIDMGSFWVGESFSVPVTIAVTGTDERGRDKEVLYQPYYRFTRGLPNSTDISFKAHAPVKPDHIENKPTSMTITSKSSPLSVSGDFSCVEAGSGTINYVGSLDPLNSNKSSIVGLDIETKVECLGSKIVSWDIKTECGGTAKITAVLDDLSEVEDVTLVIGRNFAPSSAGVQKSSFDNFTKTLRSSVLKLAPEAYFATVMVKSERGIEYRAGYANFIINPCDEPEDGIFIPYPGDPGPGISINPIPKPTPTPTPPQKLSCDIPKFRACADEFDLQGCIDACPYVSVECPPGTPPNSDCKETDQSCSNECWNTADTHIENCLVKSNCTKEEAIAGGGGAQR